MGALLDGQMPVMSYIYEKPPEPITLDVYPDAGSPSNYVMYDCKTVRSPVRKTKFKCTEDKTKIDVSIGKSDVGYELWVHYDNEPASVAADSQVLPISRRSISRFRRAQNLILFA